MVAAIAIAAAAWMGAESASAETQMARSRTRLPGYDMAASERRDVGWSGYGFEFTLSGERRRKVASIDREVSHG